MSAGTISSSEFNAPSGGNPFTSYMGTQPGGAVSQQPSAAEFNTGLLPQTEQSPLPMGGVVPITPDLIGGDQYFRQKVGITDQNPNAYSDFKKANPGQDVFSINREWQAMTPEQRAPYLPQQMFGTYQNAVFGNQPNAYQPNFQQPTTPDQASQTQAQQILFGGSEEQLAARGIARPPGNPLPIGPIPNPFAKKSAPAPRAPTPRAPVRTPRRRSVQPPLMSKPTLGRR